MWLGLAGFSPSQREQMAALFSTHGSAGTWCLAPLSDADAWVLAGDKVRVLSESTIAIHAGMPYERTLRLSMADVQRPLAFSAPLPSGFEPACTIDLQATPQAISAVAQLEHLLAPMRTQFALGRAIQQHGERLRQGVFHLASHGRLLAVLNFRTGQAGLAPFARPDLVVDAEWHSRPPAAGEIPLGFQEVTTRQLTWVYVRHTAANLLPDHYRRCVLYYRGPARVPLAWMTDSQLLLQRELADAPGTLAELRQRTGIGTAQLERDLAGLYYASCITSAPKKAAGMVRGRTATSGPADAAAPLLLGDSSLPDTSVRNRREGRTVPAALGLR